MSHKVFVSADRILPVCSKYNYRLAPTNNLRHFVRSDFYNSYLSQLIKKKEKKKR